MKRGDWPYTNWWMVKKHLPKPPAIILDLGCGTGAPMQYFNRNGGYKVYGIDAHAPTADIARATGLYEAVITGDIYRCMLELDADQFDAVIGLQVLEHLEKDVAYSVMSVAQMLSRQVVIFTVDVHGVEQEPYGDNEYQRHLSSWKPQDFISKGFNVKGIGIRGWPGDNGYGQKIPKPFRRIAQNISQTLWGPFSATYPSTSASVLVWRYIVPLVHNTPIKPLQPYYHTTTS